MGERARRWKEGERLELKSRAESSLARDISAMANTKGGVIYIGITNDGRVVGASKKDEEKVSDILSSLFPRVEADVEWVNIEGKEVLKITVPKSDRLISAGGLVYIRVGSTNRPLDLTEMLELAGENLLVSFDMMENPYAKMEEISWSIVESYLEKRHEVRGISIPEEPEERIFEMLRIVGPGGKVTNGGYLFFSRYPQRLFHYATVRVMEFSSTHREHVMDDRIIEGNLREMFDKTIQTVTGKLRRGFYIEGTKRVEDYEIPLEIVREGIANAIIHRNYLSTASIRIEIFEDRLEIINPGSFPPGVDPGHPIHKPRNPLIAHYFFDIGVVERYGSGIYRMTRIAEEKGVPKPEYITGTTQTKLILYRVPVFLRGVKDDLARKILAELHARKIAKAKELASTLGVSEDTILRRLRELIAKGLVEKRGRGKGTYYTLRT